MSTEIKEIAQRRRRNKTKSAGARKRVFLLVFIVITVYLVFEFGRLGYVCYVQQETQLRTARKQHSELVKKAETLRKLSKKYRTIEGKKELGREAGLVEQNEVRIILLPDGKESKSAPSGEKKEK